MCEFFGKDKFDANLKLFIINVMINNNLQLRSNQMMKFVIFIPFRKIHVLLFRLQG